MHLFKRLSAGLAALLGTVSVTAAQPRMTEVSIDLNGPSYPFRGWGTSLAWWAHGIGEWPEEKVDEIVRLVTSPTDGLGLTVFRYNIGGGEAPGHPPHMRRWGDVPGFKPAADGPYDWKADAGQRRVLLKLVKTSSEPAIVEAFSNSPPWWMTISGCVAGSVEGGPNLKPDFEQAFAGYLADVCKFYRDEHGLTFDTLAPFNEPDATWWKTTNRQEGCNVPDDQQARVIRLSRAALDERGLRETKISATDANSLDRALASLESYDAPTLAALGQVNAHSYGGSRRVELRDAAAARGKPLWQSETGPLSVRGGEYEQIMVVAQRVATDLNHMRPEVWCTWQIIDTGAWGSIHARPQEQTFQPSRQFHMLATFTRAIRPGDRIVPIDSDDVLAAASDKRGETMLFVINREKTPRTFKLTLRNMANPAGEAQGVRSSATESSVAIEPLKIDAGALEVTAPAESVTQLRVRHAK